MVGTSTAFGAAKYAKVVRYLKGFGGMKWFVPRPRVSESGERKKKVSISPDPDLLAWIQERTGPGREFASVTHAVERGWKALQERDGRPQGRSRGSNSEK